MNSDFNVYLDLNIEQNIPVDVIRFLPDNFYGGNHGIAIKGEYDTKTQDAKWVCEILTCLYRDQKETFFFVEDNNIHFGNHQIKLFTVSYSNEFTNIGDLLARWSELSRWYKYKGFVK